MKEQIPGQIPERGHGSLREIKLIEEASSQRKALMDFLLRMRLTMVDPSDIRQLNTIVEELKKRCLAIIEERKLTP